MDETTRAKIQNLPRLEARGPRREARGQIGVGDEFDIAAGDDFAGALRGQHAELGFARGAEASADAGERIVGVAGVTDELPSAFGDAADDGFEEAFVECAGHDDAEGTV